MSSNQPSKAKRQAQNRQQRAARAARTANASQPSASSRGRGAAGGRGLLSRLRGGAASPAGAATHRTVSEARAAQPPGLRAALSAVFAAAAAVGLCAFALRYPVDTDGDLYTREKLVADWSVTVARAAAENPDLTTAELVDAIDEWTPGRDDATVITALWPWSIAVVLPLVGAGIALWAVRNRHSSKVVGRALYATLFGAILTQGLLLLFLPVVLAVGVAMFQVRKSEMGARAPADEVIDVAEVEEVEEVEAVHDAAAALEEEGGGAPDRQT